MEQLTRWTQGYPIASLFYLKHILNGEAFSLALVEKVWDDVFRFWDRNIFELYDSELWNLMLALAPYPDFSEDFAASVTGVSVVQEWFLYLQKTGQYLFRNENAVWKFRPEIEKFLCWKRKMVYSEEKQKENYHRAAYWYEQHDRISEALECYRSPSKSRRIPLCAGIFAGRHSDSVSADAS